MLRFIAMGLFISSVMAGQYGYSSGNFKQYVSDDNAHGIDMIVTGRSISSDHVTKWKLQNEAYLNCANCSIKDQPYPGE